MLQSDWEALMAKIGFSQNIGTNTDLKSRYSETHRKYHNVSHIKSVLFELAAAKHIAEDYEAIELSLWFHDAIYNSFSKTNEKDSANLAVSFVSDNGGSKELQQTVFSLVMATEHNFVPQINDQKLIVDIDLSILGSAETRYMKFEDAIRKEYKYVPWFLFKKKRIKLLQYFLSRESIYSTEYYIDSLEKQARRNIESAIDNLKNA